MERRRPRLRNPKSKACRGEIEGPLPLPVHPRKQSTYTIHPRGYPFQPRPSPSRSPASLHAGCKQMKINILCYNNFVVESICFSIIVRFWIQDKPACCGGFWVVVGVGPQSLISANLSRSRSSILRMVSSRCQFAPARSFSDWQLSSCMMSGSKMPTCSNATMLRWTRAKDALRRESRS